ncbi:MAG TPA: metal ABC transporter substrate-binding protein [Candidatus Dormibacteraeota bacterium]|nr:metal ABC transporter substrate-binding protein [Candidatus Dormibacteraeota bacterium]
MTRMTLSLIVRVLSLLALAAVPVAAAEPLKVVATVPELGALVRAIGGDQVAVTVLAKPTEDPHFVEAKPSSVKALSEADLYVQVGLELEIGYAPVLLTGARNVNILAGQKGYVDASVAITPLDVPVVAIDRSMGDVHPVGSPHYLLDPIDGLKVAALLRDALTGLRPADGATFAANYDAFRRQLGDDLVGPTLAKKYDVEKLATLFEYGKLVPFLEQQGEANQLGGWLGALAPYRGTKAVDDHPTWTYFARRFGIEIVGHLEPKPGVPPTTKHLQEVVDLIKADHVPLLLATAYYDPRHADFVAAQTGAKVVRMANQAGSRPGTDDYLAMVNYNVEQLVAALRGS